MPSYFRQGACSLAVATFFSGAASAQTLATSARQLEPGSWKIIPYYQGTQGQDLNFRVVSPGACVALPPPAAAPIFPCGTGDVTADADGGAMVVKLLVQPWDRTQYYVFGGMGDMTLNVSGNVLTSDSKGHLVGAGVRALLMPDTVVSPAITLDLSMGWQRYGFNEVRPAATAAAGQIDQKLDIYQYQAAIELSHKFDFQEPKFSVEPYGGVKWLRSHSYLKDQRNDGGGSRIGGIENMFFSPFLGLQIPVFDQETLFAEAAFVDGFQYAAGLQVRFK